MATAPALAKMSVEEYLRTDFEHDIDYVDGFLEERGLGEFDHGRLQTLLASIFLSHEAEWNILCCVELRVQVGATRFRVPDVCVVDARSPREQVIRTPPLLCVEIMSPGDRLKEVLYRLEDFHRMGVVECWVFDPEERKAWSSRDSAIQEWTGGAFDVPGTRIALDPGDVFARMGER